MFAKVGDIGMEGDILSPFSITSDLATHFVGQRVILYPRLPSTMEVAREEALRGAAEGTVVIAEEQTAGKGRMGRIWLSPKGCVALSVILYPKRGLLPSLVMVASLAVVHAITAVTGLQSQIKCIIIESSAGDNGINYAVVGIGINVNLKTTEFTEIASVATSLSDELGREVSRLSLIKRLLVEIEPLYLSAKNSDAVYQEWRDSLVTLGRKVCARSGNDIYEGIAESVEKDGSLILRLRDGSLKRIVAGDVTLIR
jgi:BirA family biotin operon repressor/biotin-[acetyl-CoA-carboxylase] ligase